MTTRARWMMGQLMAAAAAGIFLVTSTAAKPAASTTPPTNTTPQIEVALLLDTSNSMDGLINQAQTQLWKIVNEFASAKRDGATPDLRVALFEYGNNGLSAQEGFVRLVVPLTDDLDKVSEALFALSTNGGEEYCGTVIDAAAKQLQWSESHEHLKCMFIAGNEPFTQGQLDFRSACRAAVTRGITVSTIYCGGYAEGEQTNWKEGALLADGSYMSINQDQAVATITAPQDAQLVQLSSKLNRTYIVYGDLDEAKEAAGRQVAQDAAAGTAAPAAAAERARFKASAQYVNSAWDLIDAIAKNHVKLEDVRGEHLPEAMRSMTLAERKAHLQRKSTERTRLQDQIRKLGEAREKFLAAKRRELGTEDGNTLDAAVIQAVRRQAVKKQFRFD